LKYPYNILVIRTDGLLDHMSPLYNIILYLAMLLFKYMHRFVSPVNLRKRYIQKSVITYIGASKTKNQAKRYCLFFL